MSNALKKQIKSPQDFIVLEGDASKGSARPIMSDDVLAALEGVLVNLGGENLMSNSWTITTRKLTKRQEHSLHEMTPKTQHVVFPDLPLTDAQIIRALVLNKVVTHASVSASALVQDAASIMEMMAEESLVIEQCRTSVVKRIINRLDTKPLSNAYKNRIMQTIADMLMVCKMYGFLPPSVVIDCRHRWPITSIAKTAPDDHTMELLDTFFFDEDFPIPLSKRAIYLLLRLISNRIGEVLMCSVDCINHVNDDIFDIVIPATKSSPYGQAKETSYSRYKHEWPESLLFKYLSEQQEFALQSQDNLQASSKGYLFVSESGKSLVTEEEFNDFLGEFCVVNKITTANGDIARITSHDIRHTVIKERLEDEEFSVYEVMRESLHKSTRTTLAYGTPSLRDNVDKQKELMPKALAEFITDDGNYIGAEPMQLSQTKFRRQRDLPTTKILPDNAICCNPSCMPQIEVCALCDSFIPDPNYIDSMKEALSMVQGRLSETTMKLLSDPNYRLSEAYTNFLQKTGEITSDGSTKSLVRDKQLFRICSWNVNGLRAIYRKNFEHSIKKINPDILCIQETRVQVIEKLFDINGYALYWSNSEKKGYAGTAIYTRYKPLNVIQGIGFPEGDKEGRVTTLEFENFYVVSVYNPTPGEKFERLIFRGEWDSAFAVYLAKLRAQKPVISCGDYNVAYLDSDVYNPAYLDGTPGCTWQERAAMQHLLNSGYVDTYRHLYPDATNAYTWWGFGNTNRLRNLGLRLDYILCSSDVAGKIKNASIRSDIIGSDHCPVLLDIEL